MGIFGRMRTVVAEWQPDGNGALGYQGAEDGGDVQDGTSYVVRFVNPGLQRCAITVTFYPVQYPEWGNDEWGVERQVEWSIGMDHTGTPDWSESQTDLVNEVAIYSQPEAEQKAAQFAAEDADQAELYGTWDGEPFDPEDG
jgi:hypothetical protein